MTDYQRSFICGLLYGYFADKPKLAVSDWCASNLRFNEPDNHGPFTTTAREFIREPLDSFSDARITDTVLIWASQTGKTGAIMGGAAWTLINEPLRIFWVMPTRDKVRAFSSTRWTPLVMTSRCFDGLIPTGVRRHDFAKLQQNIGGSHIDFVWGGSPAALSSDPARMVIQDEVDKFDEAGKEAGSMELADFRAKRFANPKRIKTTTPTVDSGPGWQAFLKTDQRRRYMPCPECGKFVVFVWAREFTVFKLTGEEAYVTWDQEARREDGTWNFQRVMDTARAICPFCGFGIRDGHKTKMDREGIWRPTNADAAPGHRGYHLPSMYASSVETSFGRLAVKFLQAKQGMLGLQAFITNELAEPWLNQESRDSIIEIISPPDAAPIEGSANILTADYQLLSPHLWYVCHQWNGHSRLLEFGCLDSFDELRKVQLKHKVEDNHVGLDSGHAAIDVYNACLRWGILNKSAHPPLWIGWLPMKGFDRREQWRTRNNQTVRPFTVGNATLSSGGVRLPLIEFSTNHLKDMLDRLRFGRTPWRWELCSRIDDEYRRHQDAEYKKPVYNPQTRRVSFVWVKRSRVWPDHLRDATLMNITLALLHRKLPLEMDAELEKTPVKTPFKKAA